ncbi:hypothetical protein pipiens_019828 [Culex pipiens pipiens]|uniref:Uncharacterized protein n=1 Tax=Culex pipiens pipiens TaxID=38569 RepID=A0ABD1DTM7_CULPP
MLLEHRSNNSNVNTRKQGNGNWFVVARFNLEMIREMALTLLNSPINATRSAETDKLRLVSVPIYCDLK